MSWRCRLHSPECRPLPVDQRAFQISPAKDLGPTQRARFMALRKIEGQSNYRLVNQPGASCPRRSGPLKTAREQRCSANPREEETLATDPCPMLLAPNVCLHCGEACRVRELARAQRMPGPEHRFSLRRNRQPLGYCCGDTVSGLRRAARLTSDVRFSTGGDRRNGPVQKATQDCPENWCQPEQP